MNMPQHEREVQNFRRLVAGWTIKDVTLSPQFESLFTLTLEKGGETQEITLYATELGWWYKNRDQVLLEQKQEEEEEQVTQVYDIFSLLIPEGRFSEADDILRTLNPTTMRPEVALAHLIWTVGARDSLTEYAACYQRIRDDLSNRDDYRNKVDQMLMGLEP